MGSWGLGVKSLYKYIHNSSISKVPFIRDLTALWNTNHHQSPVRAGVKKKNWERALTMALFQQAGVRTRNHVGNLRNSVWGCSGFLHLESFHLHLSKLSLSKYQLEDNLNDVQRQNPNPGAFWKPQVSSIVLLHALKLSSHCPVMITCT